LVFSTKSANPPFLILIVIPCYWCARRRWPGQSSVIRQRGVPSPTGRRIDRRWTCSCERTLLGRL